MYNLQGLIRRGIVNTNVQFERLGYISNNIANLNTNAYKSVRFEQTLDESGYLDGTVRYDHRAGSFLRTGRTLDVGLTGPGFVPVTSPAGDVQYTRDGAFTLNNEGYLVTNDGWIVGDGIKIPANHEGLRIKSDGTVLIYKNNHTEFDTLGKIPVVQFQNPEGLKSSEYNRVLATEDSGQPMLVKEHTFISQGGLERSNANYIGNINEVLRLNASMIASTRLMKVVDDMYQRSINLTQ
jgi:flagellar basal-body rod protein FlgG